MAVCPRNSPRNPDANDYLETSPAMPASSCERRQLTLHAPAATARPAYRPKASYAATASAESATASAASCHWSTTPPQVTFRSAARSASADRSHACATRSRTTASAAATDISSSSRASGSAIIPALPVANLMVPTRQELSHPRLLIALDPGQPRLMKPRVGVGGPGPGQYLRLTRVLGGQVLIAELAAVLTRPRHAIGPVALTVAAVMREALPLDRRPFGLHELTQRRREQVRLTLPPGHATSIVPERSPPRPESGGGPPT